MKFQDLELWRDEETRIHLCLKESLAKLISENIRESDAEDAITGKLYKILLSARKRHKLVPTVHRQMSVYENITDAKPVGFPDIGFCWDDNEHNQIEYHVECKRISHKNSRQCQDYVERGIARYYNALYGKFHSSGAMLGYIQKGEHEDILRDVNCSAVSCGFHVLILIGRWQRSGVSTLQHTLTRPDDFGLTHFWVDLKTDCYASSE